MLGRSPPLPLSGRGGSGHLVSVVSLPEPANDDKRDGHEVEEPSDDDEREGSSVVRVEVFFGEPVVGDPEADDHEKEGEGREEGGYDLPGSQYIIFKGTLLTHGQEEGADARAEVGDAVEEEEEREGTERSGECDEDERAGQVGVVEDLRVPGVATKGNEHGSQDTD